MAEVAVTKTPPTQPTLFPRKTSWMMPLGEGMFGANPFAMMREFAREMDRAFGALPEVENKVWWPAIECKQANGSFVVTAELPGMKKEDVKVEIAEDTLILEGERKFEETKEDKGFFRTERSYGKFYRSIPLPEGAKPEEIKAELANGVLEVKIPVTGSKPKMREIPIEDKKM